MYQWWIFMKNDKPCWKDIQMSDKTIKIILISITAFFALASAVMICRDYIIHHPVIYDSYKITVSNKTNWQIVYIDVLAGYTPKYAVKNRNTIVFNAIHGNHEYQCGQLNMHIDEQINCHYQKTGAKEKILTLNEAINYFLWN